MMLTSWLCRYIFLTAVVAGAVWGDDDFGDAVGVRSATDGRQSREGEDQVVQDGVLSVAVGIQGKETERVLLERHPQPSRNLAKRAAAILISPSPTLPPQKRQDDPQVQALSQQLQQVSQSATSAISSVSSSASSAISLFSQSAQSVRQSADQAVQSANQNAQQANQALSQTQSSASSAVAAANARATSQVASAQASASSQMSINQASLQSSASSAISAAQAAASRSASSIMMAAVSQVQVAQAGAASATGSANNLIAQVQSNSITATNVAILVTVSVVGTAVATSLGVWIFFRCRRRRRRATRDYLRKPSGDKDKPVAVRGTLGSPHFEPFSLKFPDLGSSTIKSRRDKEKEIAVEDSPQIGVAKSDFTNASGLSGGQGYGSNGDVYGVSPQGFRLQKQPSVENAASVRLIRVESGKKKPEKGDGQKPVAESAANAMPQPALATFTTAKQAKPALTTSAASSSSPLPPPPPQLQPEKPKIPPAEPPRVGQTAEDLRRNTLMSTRSSVDDAGASPWRASNRQTGSERLRFRDSGDTELSTPGRQWPPGDVGGGGGRGAGGVGAARGLSMMGDTLRERAGLQALRSARQSSAGVGEPSRSYPPGAAAGGARAPKNGGGFVTFPRVRDGPPPDVAAAGPASASASVLNRPRPALSTVAARLRQDAERRRADALNGVGNGRPYTMTR